MKLSPETKVTEMLATYPFLKDFLIGMDPHFKSLNNPLMMKTLGRVATLGKVAFLTGIKLDQLLPAIADEIKKKTDETVTIDLEAPVELDPSQRLEVLKGIIKDLHKGKDRKVLTERFQELIKDVAPWEIASMEQQLMAEGMPQEEIKRLCDVHVQVFKSSLEKKAVPGLPAGHPVHTFMLENRTAEDIMKEIETLKDPAKDREKLSERLGRLANIELHYVRKENQLFPVLETKDISGPSKVMWALHDDIRAMFKDVRAKIQSGTIRDIEVRALLQMLNDMIYKEEHILFPMALESLTEEDWGKVRKGEDEIGYAWIKPEGAWKPASMVMNQELMADKIGSINLDTGLLSVEQINLMLTHLPVDISFVNEKDEVIYYSQTAERIFPRSPGIIGRKVQNCHPPKSVDMVEKILKEFREGTRNSADFWIQMGGRFIYIRYFAVRDTEGKYKGTLEVSQDVTAIRNLQGQKRLLDWD
jgi:uncharacterized protein